MKTNFFIVFVFAIYRSRTICFLVSVLYIAAITSEIEITE